MATQYSSIRHCQYNLSYKLQGLCYAFHLSCTDFKTFSCGGGSLMLFKKIKTLNIFVWMDELLFHKEFY